MNKTLSIFALALISTSVIAASGHGYTILEHKVTVSDGVEGYSIEHPAQKKTLTGMNYAQGHSQTVKKGVPVKLTGEHEVTIQNLSGRTNTYNFGYWLSSNNKLYRVDDKVSIIHNGVFMISDTSVLNNVVFGSTGTYTLKACTYSTGNETACDYEEIKVNK